MISIGLLRIWNEEKDMQIIRLEPKDPLWQPLTAHLKASGDARWVLNEENLPIEDSLLFLAAIIDEQVVGSLTLKKQAILIPASDWAGERDRSLRGPNDEPLDELFVQTFTVEEEQRRKGIGRALQQAGLLHTKLLGCYQMRSWSSLDKKENYQLKLSLGFGFHPAIQETTSGLKVSGGYFVRVV
jgi:GNAT superfamily N-acetyltransferase